MSNRPFDADNHYYEATDAFTRHIDPAMRKRAVQWANVGGKERLLVRGAINKFIPNPTFDPIARPGSLDEYFRGSNPEAKDVKTLFGALERIEDRPEYRNRDARVKVLDEQGMDGCFLFPTLAVGMEESMAPDPEALVAAFVAFNRWLDEDWGFNYQDKLFAAPIITFMDVDVAVQELQFALERDARIVCIKGGAAHTPNGLTSPGDVRHDPFWSLVNESGITVGIHSGDAGYGRYIKDFEPFEAFESFKQTPFRSVAMADRAPYETYAALLCHGVFDRFPNIRVASIESGSEWVGSLLKKLKKSYSQNPTGYGSDPVESFKEHVWVAPYYEDDLGTLKSLIGADHILFGSDWPHAEGLAEPITFDEDLRKHGFTEEEIHQVMVVNGQDLVKRRPLVKA